MRLSNWPKVLSFRGPGLLSLANSLSSALHGEDWRGWSMVHENLERRQGPVGNGATVESRRGRP